MIGGRLIMALELMAGQQGVLLRNLCLLFPAPKLQWATESMYLPDHSMLDSPPRFQEKNLALRQ